MTTLEAMIQSVISDPSDDGVRLICADAYQEEGIDCIAKLIRTQIKMSKSPDHWRRMRSRAYLNNQDERWFPGDHPDLLYTRQWHLCGAPLTGTQKYLRKVIPKPFATCDHTIEMRRGFVNEISCSLEWWEMYGELMLASHPIERIEINGDGYQVWRSEFVKKWHRPNLEIDMIRHEDRYGSPMIMPIAKDTANA